MKHKILLCGLTLIALTACQSGGNNGLSDVDKARPGSSDVLYNDYGDTDDYDYSKYFYNKNYNLNMPDPFVLEDDGVYYIYGTTDRVGSNGVDCYATTDFHTFTRYMNIYDLGSGWVKGGIFAVEVYKINDTYYMYYSGNDENGSRALNVAVASSPTGLFVDYVGNDADGNAINLKQNKWLTDPSGYSPLDQTLLVDDDGSLYLYYSVYHSGYEQYIVGMNMSDPVTYDMSSCKVLVRPGKDSPTLPDNDITLKYTWEIMRGFWVAEGPCVIKSPINHQYYLTYSVNAYDEKAYTVCYAVSEDPLGDYHKPYDKDRNWSNLFFGYAGISIKTSKVYEQWAGFHAGTGHHSIFKAGDDYMIVYHGWKNRGEPDSFNGRDVFFDRVYFSEDGTPYTVGPTYSPQPLPESISGYSNIALNAKLETENVRNSQALIDNYVVEHYQLHGESAKEASLGKGKSYIKLTFDQEYSIGGFLIYNSAFYEYMTPSIDFINFKNGNAIFDSQFPEAVVKDEKSFIFPSSAFAYDFPDEIKATEMVICVDFADEVRLNEIYVMGRKVA